MAPWTDADALRLLDTLHPRSCPRCGQVLSRERPPLHLHSSHCSSMDCGA